MIFNNHMGIGRFAFIFLVLFPMALIGLIQVEGTKAYVVFVPFCFLVFFVRFLSKNGYFKKPLFR